MDTKDVAALTTQIVSSALQSGHMPSYDADAICAYYAKVYEQIANCDAKTQEEWQRSNARVAVNPFEDER